MTKKDFKKKYKNEPQILCIFGLDVNNHDDDEEVMDLSDEEIFIMISSINEDPCTCCNEDFGNWDNDLSTLEDEGF